MSDHFVYFGDGNAAQIIDSKVVIDEKTGITKVRFILLPTKRTEKMYGLREEQSPRGEIIREYPKTEVEFLERSPIRTRCWVFLDFNGGSTPVSRRYEELTLVIKDDERLLKSVASSKNRIFQELDIERQHRKQAIKLQTEIIQEVSKARGKNYLDDASAYGSVPEVEE